MKYNTRILGSLLFFFSFFLSINGRAQTLSTNEEKSYQKQILKYINQYRSKHDLGALILDNNLCLIARQHSENMSTGEVDFGHGGFGERMAASRLIFPKMTGFAENVAYGMQSPKEVTDDWIGSAGHRRNILGQYTKTGIGVARKSDGYLYFTQVFLK